MHGGCFSAARTSADGGPRRSLDRRPRIAREVGLRERAHRLPGRNLADFERSKGSRVEKAVVDNRVISSATLMYPEGSSSERPPLILREGSIRIQRITPV